MDTWAREKLDANFDDNGAWAKKRPRFRNVVVGDAERQFFHEACAEEHRFRAFLTQPGLTGVCPHQGKSISPMQTCRPHWQN